MDTVAAVLVLFPSGDSHEEGELSEAEKALDGLPELDNDQADACGNVVFAYDDFRADPPEWMKGRESDKAHPYWLRLADSAGQETDGGGDDDQDNDNDAPEEDGDDVDPDEGASPDAVEGVDADELARALANMDPDGDGGHSVDDLLGIEGDDKKPPKKSQRENDDPEWRAKDRDLKTREREAKLDQGADKHRWSEEDRASKAAENELRRREREQTLLDKQAREARTAEDHALKIDERRSKLAELTPEPEPPEGHRVPQTVLLVLSSPKYLEAVLKIRELRKTQLEDPDPGKKLKAARALATKSRAVLKTRYETTDPKKLAVSRHLVDLLSAIERGDDLARPNWFEGNFVTGHWIAD